MKLRLTLAYDGRAFEGWQSQPNGRTVQDALEVALGTILKTHTPPTIHGSGRTDAGVHALGQVAHFQIPAKAKLSAAAWQRAFNANLPPTIRVLAAAEAPDSFHARFDATGKRYRYRIATGPVLPPLEVGLAWHVPQKLSISALTKGCRLAEGRHDFSAFAANRGDEAAKPPDHAVRTLWSITPRQEGEILTLEFHGEGFLYKMVRLLTGSLMRVAIGREPLAWLQKFLEHPHQGKSPHCAPADGLCLVAVDYGEKPGDIGPNNNSPEVPIP